MSKSTKRCAVCGSTEIYLKEIHPDTGMDEFEERCRDCEKNAPKLTLKFRIKEKFSIRWNKWWGKHIVDRLFKIARWSARKGGYRCTWCGIDPGFDSSISKKGLRCSSFHRNCEML